jgi:hypothetical protein
MRLKTVALAVGVSALLAAGLTFGVTEASASGQNVTYYACLAKGKLTDVGTTAPTCKSTATQISWNSQGAAAPIYSGTHDNGVVFSTGTSNVYGTVATLPIPTGGNYAVTATLIVANLAGTTDGAECHLTDGTNTGEVVPASLPVAVPESPVAVSFADSIAAGGHVSLQCLDESSTGDEFAESVTITAVSGTTLSNASI